MFAATRGGAMARERIISADSHVTIRDAAILERLPARHHDAYRAGKLAALRRFDRDRLVPVYIIPIADIDEAVKEVQRVANEGARAAHLPLYPVDLGFPGYWDRVYDPLWAALSEIGMPVSQHVASNAYLAQIRALDPTPMRGVMHALPNIFMAESIAFWIV